MKKWPPTAEQLAKPEVRNNLLFEMLALYNRLENTRSNCPRDVLRARLMMLFGRSGVASANLFVYTINHVYMFRSVR